jgi:hypothetical protein
MSSGEHPFDRLRFDILWETSAYFHIVDGERRLSVRAEESGPEPWQRRAFDAFVANERALKPRVFEALLEYYQSIVDEYRAMFSPDSLHLAPLISRVEDLHAVLAPEAVYIDDLEDERPGIGLLFDCTWDDSHGVGVRVLGDSVLEVGPQDICL